MIRIANIAELDIIINLVKRTISTVYPNYYPKGAVDFFINHHNGAHIMPEIEQQMVYVLETDGTIYGTVTIKKNEIARLFVEPDVQGNGFGHELLEFAEKKILCDYHTVCLDSSLPAKAHYLKKGYQVISYHQITTENGDYLCYERMEKPLTAVTSGIHYDGKFFVPKSNTENGEADGQTLFSYHQQGDMAN